MTACRSSRRRRPCCSLPHDVLPQPRKWAERYFNLKRWNVSEQGGHFAPMETPDLLVNDIREFFRTLRTA